MLCCSRSLTAASQEIKDKGATVFSVGVGKTSDESELKTIASNQENVFRSPTFKEVISLAP